LWNQHQVNEETNQKCEGENMKAEIRGDRLLISLPLQKPTPSKSGKSLVVASTRGTKKAKIKIRGRSLRVNAIAHIKNGHPPKEV
jgi:hypothetical protein